VEVGEAVAAAAAAAAVLGPVPVPGPVLCRRQWALASVVPQVLEAAVVD
jgi:hypothetical protein